MTDLGDPDRVRAAVRARYATAAEQAAGCGCAPSCCDDGLGAKVLDMTGDGYGDVAGYVAEADLGLGCGVPTEHAALKPGETVLDLGSGAGVDAFVARREVGADGRVLGVDMTPAMLERARANVARLGYENVEFRLGEIEHLPVETGTVDVVISNCVLNLVPDKARAFAEMLRVLKPVGRFCVSDIVASGELPEAIRRAAELHVGCVAGALPRAVYLDLLRAAGFAHVHIAKERAIPLPDEVLAAHLDADAIARLRADGLTLSSVTVLGRRPA
jgi:SAM-dependent methyltransferase